MLNSELVLKALDERGIQRLTLNDPDRRNPLRGHA